MTVKMEKTSRTDRFTDSLQAVVFGLGVFFVLMSSPLIASGEASPFNGIMLFIGSVILAFSAGSWIKSR